MHVSTILANMGGFTFFFIQHAMHSQEQAPSFTTRVKETLGFGAAHTERIPGVVRGPPMQGSHAVVVLGFIQDMIQHSRSLAIGLHV